MTVAPALALHGGAGASRKLSYVEHIEHMRALVAQAKTMLDQGSPAIDTVQCVITEMEQSGLYVAGRGASPNELGHYELEACIMDGGSRRAGAVGALQGYRSPIAVARLILERTPHVLLVGEGARLFARSMQCLEVGDVKWFTPAGIGESNHPVGRAPTGTVGCVVRDIYGNLAAGTSSAGLFGKIPGRLADSCLPGAGTWADSKVAVSCTGQGELFIQAAAAVQLAFRRGLAGDLETAARQTLGDVLGDGGEGGLVAIDADGKITLPFVAEGMKRAVLTTSGAIGVSIFDEPLPS